MRKFLYRCSQCGKSHETIRGAFDCACQSPVDCKHENFGWSHVNLTCSGCGRDITEQHEN